LQSLEDGKIQKSSTLQTTLEQKSDFIGLLFPICRFVFKYDQKVRMMWTKTALQALVLVELRLRYIIFKRPLLQHIFGEFSQLQDCQGCDIQFVG
jgi:hypothetical protein